MSLQPGQFPPPADRIDPAQVRLPAHAADLARRIDAEGGRALVVGGFVRDHLWGLPHGDVDLEVYGVAPERLEALATAVASVKGVGRDFGILKVGRLDVSMPRADRVPGREGYLRADPGMPLAEAARRRDFTLNAMAWDPLSGAVYDPWNGLADLRAGRLRHVAPETFVEDPLRALRAVQFVARFPLEPDPSTLELCREVAPVLPGLPRERLFEELKKLLLKGIRIARGLEVAWEAGIVGALWPELERLRGCPQDPRWHPEGDVWVHTLMALDVGARLRTGEPGEDLAVMLAILCHDLGKPGTTEVEPDGKVRSHGHEEAGVPLTEAFLSRHTDDRWLHQVVVPLVRYHLRPSMLYKQEASDSAVRRLATQVNLTLLERVARADQLGRTTPEAARGEFPAGDWLLERARALRVETHRPAPLVQGRHLMSQGVQPGREMGELLKTLYERQLDGAFSSVEEGIELARMLRSAPAVD